MNGWYDVKADFGAVGDGSTDDTAALNSAFYSGATLGRPVWIPPGTYKVTDTLWATPEGLVFYSCHIEGAGSAIGGHERTVIDGSSIVGKPVINFQRVRGTVLKGVHIIGPNNVSTSDVKALDYEYGWVASGVRTNRYSPQCAIAIDAGVGNPGSGNTYSGFTYQNSVGGSYYMVFEDVFVEDHVVGFMIGPDTNANASDIHWYNCRIMDCREGIAVGHSQARGLNFFGGTIGTMRSAFDGRTYGLQQGVPVTFYGTQFGYGFQLFNYYATFGLSQMFGVRTEGVHRIGYAGESSTSGFPITFYGCDFHFLNTTTGLTTNLILEAGSQPVLFSGCMLDYDGGSPPAGLWTVAQTCTFDSCQLSVAHKNEPFVGNISYGAGAVQTIVKNTRVSGHNSSGAIQIGTEGLGYSRPTRIVEHPDGPHMLLRYVYPTTEQQHLYKRQTWNPNTYVAANSATSLSAYLFTDNTVTFTVGNAADSYIMVGDYLEWRMLEVSGSTTKRHGPTLKVTSISGNDITCTMLSPNKYYDQTYAPANVSILMRAWAPGMVITGNTSVNNTAFTNVTLTGINWLTAPPLQAGDWIQTSGSNFPAGTRIVSVAVTESPPGTVTAVSVTMSKGAATAGTGVSIYWDRLHALTSTAAF